LIIKRALLKPLYSIYESSLKKQIAKKEFPQHIGIILDGNRRHARSIGIPVEKVYEIGSDKLEEVLDWLWSLKVHVASVWIFSTENFKRDAKQVAEIMKMAEQKTVQIRENDNIHEKRVQVRYSGDMSLLSKSLQEQIDKTEEATEMYNDHILNVCLAYGGRAELTSAVKKIASHVKNGNLDLELIDEDVITQYLYTNGLPDPDLIIRTSGSIRLSGFLMWQSTYSELYFTDVLWPEFRKIDLYRAIRDYQIRKRNFGG
jgi:tritrans,polycis-undecaprenyl-diphosphate synthase [geranylgeranyl-diphosphate specific]